MTLPTNATPSPSSGSSLGSAAMWPQQTSPTQLQQYQPSANGYFGTSDSDPRTMAQAGYGQYAVAAVAGAGAGGSRRDGATYYPFPAQQSGNSFAAQSFAQQQQHVARMVYQNHMAGSKDSANGVPALGTAIRSAEVQSSVETGQTGA
jgi:hypothetical protein